MKKMKIVELEIVEDDLESGVGVVSLVDEPATLRRWLAFKDESEPQYIFTEEIMETILGIALEFGIEEKTYEAFTDSETKTDSEIKKQIISDVRTGNLAEIPIGEENAVILYKYASVEGKPAQRNFCKAMMAVNRLYTRNTIEAFSSVALNPKFNPKSGSYDIFDFRGGVNCQHYWKAYKVWFGETTSEKDGKVYGAIKKAESVSDDGTRNPVGRLKMSKFAIEEQGDQRILVGIGMIPDFNIYRKNPETGEEYFVRFSKATIQKAAEKFLKSQSVWSTSLNHEEIPAKDTYVFESWIVEHMEDKANKIYRLNAPLGSWILKMRVEDDDTWKRIKKGELNGFSIEGLFNTKEAS